MQNYVFKRKYFEKDTLINEKIFKKFRWETLGFVREIIDITYTYEILNEYEYKLLDSALNTVHSIKLISGRQTGVIFYEEQEISDTVFLSLGVNFGSKINYVGYQGSGEFSSAIYFNEDLSQVEYTSNFLLKTFLYYLYGEPIEFFCQLFDRGIVYPDRDPSFKKIGDKLQYVIFADLNYIDKHISSDVPIYADSMVLVVIVDVEYFGDTIINGKKNNILKSSFARLDEGKIEEELVYTNIDDNKINDTYNQLEYLSYYRDSYPHYGGDADGRIFSAYYTDTTIGIKMGVILNSIFMPYWGNMTAKYYLDFPFPIVNVSTQKTEITYIKVDGVEYGSLTIIPDTVTINEILSIDYIKDKIFVEFRLNDSYNVQIGVEDKDHNTLIETDEVFYEKGKHLIEVDFKAASLKIDTITVVLKYVNVEGQFISEEVRKIYKIQ